MLSYDSMCVLLGQQPLLHASHQDNAKPLRSFPIRAYYLYAKIILRLGGVDKLFV